MSVNRASQRKVRLATLVLVVGLLVLLVQLPVGAQTPLPASEVLTPAVSDQFHLDSAARERLARLQADWLDWLVACNEGDPQEAELSLASLLDHTSLVGMEHVPALSAAAAVRAVEFAEKGDRERAAWSLEAAERLGGGRPEAAFAAVRVAQLNSNWIAALRAGARGYWRMLTTPGVRFVLMHNLVLWFLAVVTLAGLLFVGVQMVARGPELYFDIFRYLARFAPDFAAHLLCLILLSWPLLLPAGLLWTAIYWSVLLWGVAKRAERVLVVLIWLVVGSLPALVSGQSQRVGLELFAPMQSIESASQGALDGELFQHLGLLRSILPESRALKHFEADMHRKLGQMERARTLYREVVEVEPGNAAALNDLGIYFFEVSDFDRAAEQFNLAAESGQPQAPVLFNLSQTYSELYRFNESEESLVQARSLDSERVTEWMRRGLLERVVPLDGGLARVDEIRSALRIQWQGGETLPGWLDHWLRTLSLPLILVFGAIALLVRLFARRGRVAKAMPVWWTPAFDRARRVVLAGVPEAEEGMPVRALLWLVLLVALASLPLVGRIGYSLPWLYDPPSLFLPTLSLVGLGLLFAVRFVYVRRDRP